MAEDSHGRSAIRALRNLFAHARCPRSAKYITQYALPTRRSRLLQGRLSPGNDACTMLMSRRAFHKRCGQDVGILPGEGNDQRVHSEQDLAVESGPRDKHLAS